MKAGLLIPIAGFLALAGLTLEAADISARSRTDDTDRVWPMFAFQPSSPVETDEAEPVTPNDPVPTEGAPDDPPEPEQPQAAVPDASPVLTNETEEIPGADAESSASTPAPEKPSAATAAALPSRESRSRAERGSTRPDAGSGRSSRVRESSRSRTGPRGRESGGKLPATSSGSRDYAAFKVIIERNIFDATRSARSNRTAGEPHKPNRVDTITLVGILSYEKGPYAFFDGSSAEYKKVLEPGKSIAGYRLAEITSNAVELESGTNKVRLQIGMKMRREDGEWRVTESGGAPAEPETSSAGPSSDSSSEESDIVKRMMQQREQELK